KLCTTVPVEEVDEIEGGLAAASIRPDGAKRKMGRSVVALYHGSEAAEAAEDQFDLVHRRHEIPRTVREVQLPPGLAGERTIWLPRLLSELGLGSCHSDARRQIEQGGASAVADWSRTGYAGCRRLERVGGFFLRGGPKPGWPRQGSHLEN